VLQFHRLAGLNYFQPLLEIFFILRIRYICIEVRDLLHSILSKEVFSILLPDNLPCGRKP
jgi:hypothetical protein